MTHSAKSQRPLPSAEQRSSLIKALRHAVSFESRFGKLAEAQADVNAAWEAVADLIASWHG